MLTKRIASAIRKMRHDVIFSAGIFPEKTKAHYGDLWFIRAKYELCLKYYVVKAKELGLSEEELGEILAVGSVMGECVREMWAFKAYHAFKEADWLKEACCAIHS